MKNTMPPTAVALAVALALILSLAATGCSSAPKRPAEVFSTRNAALGQLELANKSTARGQYENALLFLDEAWRLAVSTDDPETRIRVLLSRGNARFNEGEYTLADAAWRDALAEAEFAGNETLIGAAKVYMARGTLAEGIAGANVSKEERALRAAQAKTTAVMELKRLSDNALYEAFAWKLIGLAEKELGNAAAAEKAILSAFDIHEKGRYLEDAAYDWYLIASVRSKAGDFKGARAALYQALEFDRRAENANGLGMDWVAIGLVEEKSGDKATAAAAYRRAVAIFRAGFLPEGAREATARLAALGEEVTE